MRRALVLIAVAACDFSPTAKQAPPSPAPTPPPPAPKPVAKPAPPPPPVDEETQLRAGKATGVDGKKPEVMTEDLVRKLADGSIPASRFLDPKQHLVRFLDVHQPMAEPVEKNEKLCGDAAAKAAVDYFKLMAERRERHPLSCLNEPDGRARCSAGGEGEWDESLHVSFVPDRERGFRITLLRSWEIGSVPDHDDEAVEKSLAATNVCK